MIEYYLIASAFGWALIFGIWSTSSWTDRIIKAALFVMAFGALILYFNHPPSSAVTVQDMLHQASERH